MDSLSLCAFADEAGASLSEQIDALHANRIPMIEIRGVDGRNITDFSLDEARQLARRLKEEGIRVWSIGSPCGKIGIRDPFPPHLDLFRHTLELADILGARCVRLFSFYLNGLPHDACRDEVLDRLSRMVQAACGSEVLLCHENEKGIYGDTAARCEDIHRALPSLKAVFDPANFLQCGQNTLEAFDRLSPHIAYFHVKDCAANGTIVPAGQGVGHLVELLHKFRAQGGQVVTLEPHLAVFAGLERLEQGAESEIEGRYPTQRAAFDAAAMAMRRCLPLD